MDFYTLAFVIFLAAALAAYYLVGRVLGRGQWVVLLAASLGFYAFFGWQNFAFIGVTAASTWACGLAFARIDADARLKRKAAVSRDEKKAVKKRALRTKRLVLLAALVLNFGILSYLKYAEVLVGYLAPQSGWSAGLLLPLGISFYTFQTISYVVDVYNEKYDPERNFARYLLFASFFPQLIQGPINRFDSLACQLYERHSFDARRTRSALLQVGYGCLKKYAIANILVMPVDAVFDSVDSGMPGSVIVAAILLYAIYQYADFSGGIDMVIGIARLFGVEMSPNFRQPYFSVSLGDFWRRWHITLGAWMRDYVFYPFALMRSVQGAGKWLTARFGKHIGHTLPACVANIIVFFLVGLWHGAESHFILWGLYNGLVIAASDLLTPVWDRLNRALHVDMDGAAHRVFCIVRTFIVVNIGWYFDRIEGFDNVMTCFYNTVFNFQPDLFVAKWELLAGAQSLFELVIAGAGCITVFVVSVLRERGVDVSARVLDLPVLARAVLYVGIVTLVAASFMFAAPTGFMYANF